MADNTFDIYREEGERFEFPDAFHFEFDYDAPDDGPDPWEVEQAIERSAQMVIKPSQFVEESIQIPNPETRKLEGFNFGQRRYLRRIYDNTARRKLLVFGRQSEKTTFIGNISLTYSCLIPHFKVLYVSPSSTQTKVFSKERLKEAIDVSPVLKGWFPGMLTDNVFEKKALNRSLITLRYAFLNADRVRGCSSDFIAIDEFQDVLLDNIPVIEESASHSPFKWFYYCGTPKSLDNPIEDYWQTRSTQNEWAIPCERHGTPKNPGSWHWNILSERNMTERGLACDKCFELISPQHPLCDWVPTGTPDPKYEPIEGFHIPQLMVPWIAWSDVWYKYNHYPRSQFFNEVLGMSYDSGQRPLTQDDLIANCDPNMRCLGPEGVKDILELKRRLGATHLYGGVDWGQDSTNSFTVLVLGAYVDGFFRFFFFQRFTGSATDPGEQLRILYSMMDALGIRRLGTDYGGGHTRNSELLKKYGSQKVVRYQYSMPSVFLKYDNHLGRFLVHRAEVMGAIFAAFKRGTVFRLPRWSDIAQPFASDCLAIFSEYNERTRMTEYKKSPNTTDDTFHAMLFCFLASMIDYPREDVFIPSATVDRLQSDMSDDE